MVLRKKKKEKEGQNQRAKLSFIITTVLELEYINTRHTYALFPRCIFPKGAEPRPETKQEQHT